MSFWDDFWRPPPFERMLSVCVPSAQFGWFREELWERTTDDNHRQWRRRLHGLCEGHFDLYGGWQRPAPWKRGYVTDGV